MHIYKVKVQELLLHEDSASLENKVEIIEGEQNDENLHVKLKIRMMLQIGALSKTIICK